MSTQKAVYIDYCQHSRAIRDAEAASFDPKPSQEKIEDCMRRLFLSDIITPQSIGLYNRLERTWKLLTGWVDEEKHLS